MNYHSQLNIIMLVTVIGLAISLYLRPASDSVSEHMVAEQSADTVKLIRIIRNEIEITLNKLDGYWYIEKPLFVAADKEKVDRILEILSATSQQRFALSEQAHLGQDQPIVELYIDQLYFGFGGLAPTTNLQYLVTDQNIHLVSPRYAVFLPSNPLELVSTSLLAKNEIPVQYESANWRVYQQESVWRAHFPGSEEETMNSQELNDWHQLWRNVHASNIAFHAQTDTDRDANKITISLQGGREIVFTIMRNGKEFILLRDDEAISYFFPPEIGERLLSPDGTIL